MSIYQQMEDSKKTSKLIEKNLQKLLESSTIPQSSQPSFILYTGLHGMCSFDFVFKYGEDIYGWVNYYQGKQIVGKIFLSLFRKESLYKVLIKNRIFELRKGTTVLLSTKDIKELNLKIKSLL